MWHARRYVVRLVVGAICAWMGSGCGPIDGSVTGPGGNSCIVCLGSIGPAIDSTPVRVQPTRTFADLQLGPDLSCGLSAAGALSCWGRMGPVYEAIPKRFDFTGGYRAVGPTAGFLCAIAAGGGVQCWGSHGAYELGIAADAPYTTPSSVPGTDSLRTIAVATPTNLRPYACGLTGDGRALCWGNDVRGSLGRGPVTGLQTVPTEVGGDHRFVSLSVRTDHACAVTASGDAYCWGSNEYGQIGDGTTTDRSVPTRVLGGHDFVQVVTGRAGSCGLTREGGAYCWGSSIAGGTVPAAVPGTPRFATLAMGETHTCALTGAGAAWCWGDNMFGQVGNGATSSHQPPVAVATAERFTHVTLSGFTSCGLTAQGAAWCWGADHSGLRSTPP